MARLIQIAVVTAITESLELRSDIHPKEQLKALEALRDRMQEHIDPDAMFRLESTIDELESDLAKAGMV